MGRGKGKACLTVLRFDAGRLFDSENFIIERPENPSEARRELIRSFYSIREKVPPKICVVPRLRCRADY